MIQILSILLLCCLSLRAASPFFYCPTTNDLVAIEITAKNARMVAMLSGNATTNSYTRFFIYNTNSTATLDGKTVFKPTNQAGRWEEVSVIDAASGFRVAGAAASGNYLRGNATSFVPSAIAAADLNVLATAGGSAMLNSDSSGNIQGLANVRGSLMQGGIANWTTTTIGASGRVWTSDGTDGSWQPPAAGTAGNPSASVGLSAVNGAATTYMRSDGAPALDVTIAPTWTGLHNFNLGAVISDAAAYDASPVASIQGKLKYRASGSYAAVSQIVFGKENSNDIDDAGYLSLQTKPNGGSQTERLKITSAGAWINSQVAPIIQMDRLSGTADVYTQWSLAGANKAYIGISGGTSQFITGSVAGDICIRGDNQDIIFSTLGSGTVAMKIYQSGSIGMPILTASKFVKTDGTSKLISSDLPIRYLNSQYTIVGNVSTGEDTLQTYTLPAATMASAGDRLNVRASGMFANTANTKALKFYIGSVAETVASAIIVNVLWVYEIDIIRITATSVATRRTFSYGTAAIAASTGSIGTGVGTTVDTLANSTVIKFTGEATADHDVDQYTMSVTYYAAP